MKEIVIGSDKKPIFNSISLWKWAPISENAYFYKLESDVISNTLLYVAKDSKEGMSLKEWLLNDSNRNKQSVHDKALELMIPYLTIDDLYNSFDLKIKEAWRDGYKKAQRDICKALGVD